MLIINADDLGRSVAETDAALTCFRAGRITSASLMVFMDDSERAARLAQDANLDVGLHLNFTAPFTASDCPPDLVDAQNRLAGFLRRHRYAQLVYHPVLRKQFAESYRAQAAEFARLFGGAAPSHVDGHHHMHLCANLLLSGLVPANTRMRRHFSFGPGEKSWLNRFYRRSVDRWLARRYRLAEFFFDLRQSLEFRRLDRVLALAKTASVEVMTHPISPAESEFLLSDRFSAVLQGLETGSHRRL
jgi:predicted glycoside hydrolase/deacetylase ChbG (UPF0249 family)